MPSSPRNVAGGGRSSRPSARRYWRQLCSRRALNGVIVFHSNGFCVLIHAEEHRILLGFLRGKRLVEMEPRIKPSGKYELGNWTFRENDAVDATHVTALAARAQALNAELGDPTAIN